MDNSPGNRYRKNIKQGKNKKTMVYKLSDSNPIPLYMQLQDTLRQQIAAGDYMPGERIPSEQQLKEMYDISRITVRKAIEGLILEGLLKIKRGIGTIVATSPYVDDDHKLRGFTEKGLIHHSTVTTKVLEKKTLPSSERISAHLQIDPGTEVLYIKRLRYSSGEPILIFENYLRTDIGIPDDYDFSGSIYYLLEHVCRINLASAEKIISAAMADSEQASLLELEDEDAVLTIRNTTYDAAGKPVEYAEGVYRADKYQYVVHVNRK